MGLLSLETAVIRESRRLFARRKTTVRQRELDGAGALPRGRRARHVSTRHLHGSRETSPVPQAERKGWVEGDTGSEGQKQPDLASPTAEPNRQPREAAEAKPRMKAREESDAFVVPGKPANTG